MQKISIPTLQHLQAFRKASLIDKSEQLKKYRDVSQKMYEQQPGSTHKDDDWRFIAAPKIAWDILCVTDAYIPKIELGNGAFICDLRSFYKTKYSDALILSLLKEGAHKNVFSTLANSSWNRGYVVYIPKNTTWNTSIDLQNVLPAYQSDLLLEKVIIVVESGAQVTIQDVLRSKKIKAQTVIRSVDLVVKENAHVTFVHDQDWDKHVQDISTIQCSLGRNSQLHYNALISGGVFTKQWLNVDLHEHGAQAQIRGAYVLNGQQQVAINAMQNHGASNTHSDLVFKGIVADGAHAVYQGTIFIDKNAPNSDATQNNKNILLGEQARAYSIPNLQVLNNDVQCAHGSAVGQLDAEQMLYAQARGLSKKQAQKLLLHGFLQDLFSDSNLSVSDRLKSLNI